MTKLKLSAPFILAALLMAAPAMAHDPNARHGGRIVHAGNYHVEMTSSGKTIDVFLLGHDDKPITAEGYKGVAILAIAGKSQRVTLAAADVNRLTGTSETDLPEEPKGVVQITAPTGAVTQARFK